ncbi:helix-turn-helix domain-containing protein [Cellulomonas soli]|uniref:helix-turn-helix domain-containing protein n=1 Tax=Cellulomonas soli TaxID=931535 RepID=UPI003F8538D1
MTDDRRPLWSHPRSPADLGAFLRAARIEENVTQEALADELGFDRRVLQRIEAGEPTLYATRLFALMARLGCELELRKP